MQSLQNQGGDARPMWSRKDSEAHTVRLRQDSGRLGDGDGDGDGDGAHQFKSPYRLRWLCRVNIDSS